MRTETFTAQTLPQLLPAWRALELRAARSPLASGMLDGPLDPDGLFVAAAYEGARLQGVWPLRVFRRGLARVAVRAGRELQPYDGLVLDPSSPSAAAALWSAVRRRCPADVLQLRAIPHHSPLHHLPAVRQAALPSAQTWWLETSAMADPDLVLRRLSKSRRKSVRRRRRALEARGDVRLERLQDPERRGQAVADALALKHDWLASKDLHSFAVGSGWFEQALRRAVQRPDLVGPIEVFALSVAGEDVAFEIGFRDRAGYCSFLGAFSPAWAGLGVGTELTAGVLRWCVQEGVPRCDLLPPTSPFKAAWCDVKATVWSAQIPLSRRGRLLRPAAGAARKLKPLYLSLSPDIRRRLNSLLQRLQ